MDGPRIDRFRDDRTFARRGIVDDHPARGRAVIGYRSVITMTNARLFCAATLVSIAGAPAAAQNPRPAPTTVWAPKPVQTPAYAPPQQPWVKLAEIKRIHKTESNWRELVVDDGRLTGEYVAAAPGSKFQKRFHPDTREWFA